MYYTVPGVKSLQFRIHAIMVDIDFLYDFFWWNFQHAFADRSIMAIVQKCKAYDARAKHKREAETEILNVRWQILFPRCI